MVYLLLTLSTHPKCDPGKTVHDLQVVDLGEANYQFVAALRLHNPHDSLAYPSINAIVS